MTDAARRRTKANDWPPLLLAEWQDTYATLHMWTQVVGKIRLSRTPLVNHWWNVALYVTASGLTTSLMPAGDRGFQIDFDLVDHRLDIVVTDVMMVRGSTELIEKSIRSASGMVLYLRRYSRMRSKMTTVSFSE